MMGMENDALHSPRCFRLESVETFRNDLWRGGLGSVSVDSDQFG